MRKLEFCISGEAASGNVILGIMVYAWMSATRRMTRGLLMCMWCVSCDESAEV